jgi:hypothetical protein
VVRLEFDFEFDLDLELVLRLRLIGDLRFVLRRLVVDLRRRCFFLAILLVAMYVLGKLVQDGGTITVSAGSVWKSVKSGVDSLYFPPATHQTADASRYTRGLQMRPSTINSVQTAS